jgi:hypothetical protein
MIQTRNRHFKINKVILEKNQSYIQNLSTGNSPTIYIINVRTSQNNTIFINSPLEYLYLPTESTATALVEKPTIKCSVVAEIWG